MNLEKMIIIDTSDFDEYPAYPSVLNKIEFICPWSLREDVEVSFYIDYSEFKLRPFYFFMREKIK